MDIAGMPIERAAKELESDDQETRQKAAELLKSLWETEQAKANAAKLRAEQLKLENDLRSRLSRWKDLLTAASPVLTAAVLAGTLVFQVVQNRSAEDEKRAEAEKQAATAEQGRFTQVVYQVRTAGAASGAILLKSFTKEPQKSHARQLGLTLMLSARNVDDFKTLYSAIIEPATHDDLNQLLQLNRSVSDQYTATAPTGLFDEITGAAKDVKQTDEEKQTIDRLWHEIKFLSDKIVPLLRQPRAAGEKLDLNGIRLVNADLTGADLHARYFGLLGSNPQTLTTRT